MLMPDVGLQRLEQVQRARHAVDQGHGVHREVRLQRRVLVEVVEDDERRGVALQLDRQPRLAVRGLVVDIGDALDLAGLDELFDLGRGSGDRRLIRHLRHDDLIVALAFFDLGDGA